MNQSNIGLFIQSLRKEKGLTQRELADRLGISDKAVSKWETARSMPDTSLLEPLCSELGISINELILGEKLPPEDYAKKAEVTIMNLYTENQENRKITPGQTVLLIVGALLALLAAFFLLLSVAGMNSRFYMMFLDLPSFIILLVGCIAAVFLSRAKSLKSILSSVRSVVIPISILETIVGLMAIWNQAIDLLDSPENVNAVLNYMMTSHVSYEVAALPLVYGFVIYIIATVWLLSLKPDK